MYLGVVSGAATRGERLPPSREVVPPVTASGRHSRRALGRQAARHSPVPKCGRAQVSPHKIQDMDGIMGMWEELVRSTAVLTTVLWLISAGPSLWTTFAWVSAAFAVCTPAPVEWSA